MVSDAEINPERIVFHIFFPLQDWASLYSLGWPRTLYVDQAGLRLTCSLPPMMGLKVCAITAQPFLSLTTTTPLLGFENGSHSVVKASLELMVLSPYLIPLWDIKCAGMSGVLG